MTTQDILIFAVRFVCLLCALKLLTNWLEPRRQPESELTKVLQRLELIMSTQQELAAQLTAATEVITTLQQQVGKIGTETNGLKDAIAALETQIGNQSSVAPELQAAFDNLKTSVDSLSVAVQGVDDEVTDTQPADPSVGSGPVEAPQA